MHVLHYCLTAQADQSKVVAPNSAYYYTVERNEADITTP